MRRALEGLVRDHWESEKVAYWYFRLNGFFQIENFVVHPRSRGSQRTDADLLAVRFPHRAERLIDDPNDVMADDVDRISLSHSLIDVVIAEVKTSESCTLNGPWTREGDQNVHRVLAAIGCLPADRIEAASADIYRAGVHVSDLGYRIRLVAVGEAHNDELATTYPEVTQLIWVDMLAFIWTRFRRYRRQKTQVDQWNPSGLKLKELADGLSMEKFIEEVLRLMGVRRSVLQVGP